MASGDKFCWSCGSALLAKDIFCRECGADLRKDEPVAQDTQDKPTPKEKVPMVSPTEDSLPVMDDRPGTTHLYIIGAVGWVIGILALLGLVSSLARNTDGVLQGNYWGVMNLVAPILFALGGIGIAIWTGKKLRNIKDLYPREEKNNQPVVEDQAPPVSGTSADEKVERAAFLEAEANNKDTVSIASEASGSKLVADWEDIVDPVKLAERKSQFQADEVEEFNRKIDEPIDETGENEPSRVPMALFLLAAFGIIIGISSFIGG